MLRGVLKSKSNVLMALCFLFLIVTTFVTLNYKPKENNVPASKQTFTAYVSAEPDIRQDGVRYILKTSNTKVYVKSGLYPRYSYGDLLEINCRLEIPEPIEDFRYDMYLKRFGVSHICVKSVIKKIGTGEGNIILSGILKVKESIADRVNILWHEPYAGFMAGLLYGYRGGLGSLNDQFARTGVTHIIAISGYNITIVSSILMSLCISLLIPRKKAFYFITLGIAVFVVFAGASGSVVRAGIMGFLVLFARQMGRTSRVGNVMLLTAVIMTIHNPYILVWDAGFQLSFLSTIGLVYLAPKIEKPLKKIPDWLGIKESFVATLSATLITLPLILYQFGRLSVVALPVNMLILWIIPIIMFTGFAAVILSYLFDPLAQILAWLAWLGMKYITEIVGWFANLSFASVEIKIPIWSVFVIYIVLLLYINSFTRWWVKSKITKPSNKETQELKV